MKTLSRARFLLIVGGLGLALLTLLPLAACLGSQVVLGPGELLRLIEEDLATRSFAEAWQGWTGTAVAHPHLKIFFALRLKGALLAALIGAALGAAGACFQATLRNPLADPYILGISGGGCLGALVARMLLGATSFAAVSVVGMAFAAAAGTLFLVIFLAGGWRAPEHLLLTGVVVNALYSAAILLVSSMTSNSDLADISLYLMGYLQVSRLSYPALGVVAGFVGAAVLYLQRRHRALNLLALVTDDEARALGVPVDRARFGVLLAASLLTAAAVSLAGPIGFVGLIVPHCMRLAWGADHRLLLATSALGGGVFLVLADLLGRTAVQTHQLPVGVVTAVIGGSFFLFLLARQRRRKA